MGDLAHPSDVIARDISRWLERRKYFALEVPEQRRLSVTF